MEMNAKLWVAKKDYRQVLCTRNTSYQLSRRVCESLGALSVTTGATRSHPLSSSPLPRYPFLRIHFAPFHLSFTSIFPFFHHFFFTTHPSEKKKLKATHDLSDVFKEKLPKKTIHIIVQRPPQGNADVLTLIHILLCFILPTLTRTPLCSA